MARKNRTGIDFSALSDMVTQLNRLNKSVDTAVENALLESKKYVTPIVQREMQKHNGSTGKTKAAIEKNNQVKNDGVGAHVDVGFDISKEINTSGFPVSIFLMYGTPKQAPDKKLYNAIYGSKTRKEIAKIQEEEFLKVLQS